MSKGDTPRKRLVDKKTYDQNWERIFGEKKDKAAEKKADHTGKARM